MRLSSRYTEYTPLAEMVKEDLLPNVTKIEENIWVIKNFIPEDILAQYDDFISNLPEEEWFKSQKAWWYGKIYNIGPDHFMYNVSDTVLKMTLDILQDNIALEEFDSIHRLIEGTSMPVHTDNPAEIREINGDNGSYVSTANGKNSYAILATVHYLNNFNGANLYFPNLGIEYHGTRGDLIMFPGVHKKYDHGVRPLEAGPNRHILITFGHDKSDAPLVNPRNHLYPDKKFKEDHPAPSYDL